MFYAGKEAIFYFLSAVAMIAVAGTMASEISHGANQEQVERHDQAMSPPIKREAGKSVEDRPVACRIIHKAVPNRPLKFIGKKLSKVRLFKRRNR